MEKRDDVCLMDTYGFSAVTYTLNDKILTHFIYAFLSDDLKLLKLEFKDKTNQELLGSDASVLTVLALNSRC